MFIGTGTGQPKPAVPLRGAILPVVLVMAIAQREHGEAADEGQHQDDQHDRAHCLSPGYSWIPRSALVKSDSKRMPLFSTFSRAPS